MATDVSLPENIIPDDLRQLIDHRDGAAKLTRTLPEKFTCEQVAESALNHEQGSPHFAWEMRGSVYLSNGRVHESVAIFESLYDHLLLFQAKTGTRAHKGAPLVMLSECHKVLGNPVISRRNLMLATCEDSIHHLGNIESAVDGGVYFRAVWAFGLAHSIFERYFAVIWDLYQRNQAEALFPEWVIQQIDQDWMTSYPTPQETADYRASQRYFQHLLGKLGTGDGRALELLAHYLLSVIPGCKAHLRQLTGSTDLDVAGAFEGPVQDFRTDIGRYFVCECKDWEKPADFTAFAKFCRVLDSSKCRFGILFSKRGISGASRTTDAALEQMKMFQDRGVIVVVINEDDLRQVSTGANLVAMLRQKYEQVRLDLRSERARG